MDIQLPEWALDVERQRKDIMYGRIPIEFVVFGNKITKIVGTKSKQYKFKNNEEAKIFVLDCVSSGENSGTTTFSVVRKDGKISQVNVFEQIEVNYPAGDL